MTLGYFTLSILLTTILAILTLLWCSSINLIASTTTSSVGKEKIDTRYLYWFGSKDLTSSC